MEIFIYLTNVICVAFFTLSAIDAKQMDKKEVDKVIEEEITEKLSDDLLQSIEKKFNVDLERSVDSVLQKIKLLLQNGTTQIQEKLSELQVELNQMKKEEGEQEVDSCLLEHQNDTTALAERALHQMVVCGYALIGHDPAQAVRNVMELKSMIKKGLKPINEKKEEVYNLLKVCGHDHDSLKKVIKCVISKSPQIKSAMMTVSSKLIDGVVHLTKQMAHGAMHEACLIEVIKTVEEEAFGLLIKVRQCTSKNNTAVQADVERYMKENNATVLDIKKRAKDDQENKEAVTETAATTVAEAKETNAEVTETKDDQAETKAEATTEVKPEVRAEDKPEDKLESKPEDKSEDKPEDKPEEQSEDKPEDKQEAKPEEPANEIKAENEEKNTEVEDKNKEIKTVLRRMLKKSKADEGLEKSFRHKKKPKDHGVETNVIASDSQNKDKDK